MTPGLRRLVGHVPGVARIGGGWRKLRPIVGGRMLPVAALGAVSIVAGLVEASVLTLLANIAATMVLREQQVAVDVGPIALRMTIGGALIAALVLTAVRLLLQLVVAWLPARIGANVMGELRKELFDAFTRASWAVKAADLEGKFQELMTNQITYATGAVMNVALVISSGAMFLALAAAAFSLSVVVAALVLVSAVVLFLAFRPLDRVGHAAARDVSQAYIDQANGISEAVRLAEEAQVFGVAEAFRARMGTLIECARAAYFRATLTVRLVGSLYQSAVFLIIVGGIGGLFLAHAGHLAALGAVVLILVRASSYGQQMQTANHAVIQVLPFLDRLYGSIDYYQLSAQVDRGAQLEAVEKVVFDNVTFSYRPGEVVLQGVSFAAEGGETIGIIGPTGAGKSSIAQLLLRLREPDSGAYLINGVPARNFDHANWQTAVAYVSQEPRLYRGTVAENIRFFRNIGSDAVEQAARLAHVHGEIMAMPEGYNTVIGQQADAVSGGQRQRICLARALVGQPKVLILDEPTSALDLASEAAVEASLAGLHGRVTVFIIAHRLSVLGLCDRVLVLDLGRVRGFAPVSELARSDPFYQKVVSLGDRRP